MRANVTEQTINKTIVPITRHKKADVRGRLLFCPTDQIKFVTTLLIHPFNSRNENKTVLPEHTEQKTPVFHHPKDYL